MRYKFQQKPGAFLTIQSILYFAEENFIDDDTVDCIMDLFSQYYNTNGQYLFIPHKILNGWRNIINNKDDSLGNWEWNLDELLKRNIQKIFAIVYMSRHWGAICIDLTTKTILFGDSLSKSIPQDALDVIKY